jgi:hypothetical protein
MVWNMFFCMIAILLEGDVHRVDEILCRASLCLNFCGDPAM